MWFTDVLTYTAMALLVYTFRVRATNPYYRLDDFTDTDNEHIQMGTIQA